MLRKLARGLLLGVLCAGILVSTASASHYIWLIFDSAKQFSSWAGPENRLSWWVAYGTHISIWGDTTVSGAMSTATSKWNTKIPQIKFHTVTSESSADVTYKAGSCGGARGCHSVTNVFIDTDRNANWTTKSAILVDTSIVPSSQWHWTLSHETGHHLGYHERYDEATGGCNSSEVSIMEISTCHPELDGSPSDTDKFRADNFLGSGYVQNLAVSVSGSKATVTWKDYAAGELHHLVTVKRSDGTAATTKQITKDIGLRAGLSWTADRTIQYVFDRVALGLPAGNYSFCVKPWFGSYSQYGVEDCSSSYYVP